MKQTAILTLAAIVLAALIGCGQSGSGRMAGSSGAADGTEADAGSSLQDDGQGAEDVELEFLQFMPATAAFDAVIEKFQKQYPHIRINQAYLPNAASVLEVRMLTGDAPDLFAIGADAAYRNYAKKQLLADLSNESFMNRVSPVALDIIDFEGKKYGMPGSFNTMGVYYNKSIFRELGIDIPQTKAEWIAAAERIEAAGIHAFVFPDRDMPTIHPFDFQSYTGVFDEMPKKIFWDAMDEKEHLTDNEALNKAAQLYLHLRQYRKDSADIGLEEGIREFAAGQAAMMPYVSFAAGMIRGMNPDLEFSIFPIPGDDPADIRVPVGIGFQLAISSGTKHMEEAKLFLDFWSQPGNAALFESMDLSPSAIADVPSSIKETALLRDYIDREKVFQWPGEKYWTNKQLNEFGEFSKIMIQTGDIKRTLAAMDGLFYGVN